MKHSTTWHWHQLFGLLIAAVLALSVVTVGSLDVAAQAGKKGKKSKNKKGKNKKGKKKNEKPKPPPEKKYPKDKTPPLFTLKGHKYWVQSVSISPNGQYVVTASRDKTIKIWDLHAKKEIKSFKEYKTDVKRNAVFSPKGDYIVSTTGKVVTEKKGKKGEKKKKEIKKWVGEIKFWDAKSGKELKTLKGHSWTIEDVAFSHNGKYLATASADKTAIIWDVASGKQLHTLKGHGDAVLAVAFSPNDAKLATASADKTVKVWDVKNGKDLQTLKGAERDMTSVAFSPKGNQIAAGSLDGKVYIWNTSGKQVRKVEAHNGIWSVAYSPNGKYLAASGYQDTAQVWDAHSGKELFYRNGHKGTVLDVVFTPDNDRMITVGVDQNIQVWEVPKK